MLTAALTITAFTILARGVCGYYVEPFTFNRTLETDCSGPPAENHVAEIPDISYPFRTDYLTLHEGMAYREVHCSPTAIDYCLVESKRDKYSPLHKTYFELDCSGGWRSFVQAYTNRFSKISPNRALKMKISERSDIKDPVHPHVFEPVRGQVIDVTISAGASTEVTTKIYHIGILPSLVALRIEKGENLSIKRHDFNRIPNVRTISFFMTTIMEMEPYTFTDLPHISSLSVASGLRFIFNRIDDFLTGPNYWRGTKMWYQTDLDKIRRIHCDCSFAWYRNFLYSKPELLEKKDDGAMAVIGSYMSEYFDPFGYKSHVSSIDCAKNLTKDNYEAENGRRILQAAVLILVVLFKHVSQEPKKLTTVYSVVCEAKDEFRFSNEKNVSAV